MENIEVLLSFFDKADSYEVGIQRYWDHIQVFDHCILFLHKVQRHQNLLFLVLNLWIDSVQITMLFFAENGNVKKVISNYIPFPNQ